MRIKDEIKLDFKPKINENSKKIIEEKNKKSNVITSNKNKKVLI